MLRARTQMEQRGYELEVDEFVRVELSIAGKKRSTNVWMDYVHEQNTIEQLKEQQRSIKVPTAEEEWESAMSFTLSDNEDDDSTPSHVRSAPPTTTTTPTPTDTGVWPPLNLASPWKNVAAHSCKGKGSFRLIDQSSYSFHNWTQNTDALPPVTTECRNKIAARVRTSEGNRPIPLSASAEKSKRQASSKAEHRKKKLFNVMWRDPNDRTAEMSRTKRLLEADNEYSEAAHVNRVLAVHDEKNDNDNDNDNDNEEDADETGEQVMAGWVAFMNEHQQNQRERYLEDGADPLPPSALVRGRQVVDPSFVPSEPSKRRALRLEKDVLNTCKDPSQILPIPTLNRKHFKVVLDYIGEQTLIRFNLIGMEQADLERKTFRRQEKNERIRMRSAGDEEKARLALIKFLKRAMVMAFHAWSEYTGKMNKTRLFMRKILLSAKATVFNKMLRYYMYYKEIKRNGCTRLQGNIRCFVQRSKYNRLIVRVRAFRCIRRAWHAYCARTLLDRMVKKRQDEENRVKQQLRRILLRHVVKCVSGWREQTKISRFARMMGAGNTRKRKKELVVRWRSNVTFLMHKRPMCAHLIQSTYRRMLNINRWHRVMLMHRSIKPIQRMVKVRLVKTMLVRMKSKKEALMIKVRKRMRADVDRILHMCLQILHDHATVTISHRNKLGGFERLKTKRLLAQWHHIAGKQVQAKTESSVVIQKCYRGLLGRRVGEMVKVAKQLEADADGKARQLSDLDALMKDHGPKLDPITGLPIIFRQTKRLLALLSEKIEVHAVMAKVNKIQLKAASPFASKKQKDKAKKMANVQFDSKVLSFSQRFRLRTDTSFLIGFINDEIKKCTWTIWKEDRQKEMAAAQMILDTINADAKRTEEMMAMLELANAKKEADGDLGTLEQEMKAQSYPTAGIFLHFKTASEKEMTTALLSWQGLENGGYLNRSVLVGWIARGIMEQEKPSQRVAAWKCVKGVCDESLLMEINMLISTLKKDKEDDQRQGLRLSKKKKDGQIDLSGMGEAARRRRWRGRS